MSPVSPMSVQSRIQKNRGPIIEKFCAEVDKKLNEINEFQKADRNGTYSEVIVSTNGLNKNEKEFVAKAYTDVGWKHVELRFSDENGERGGLVSVKLYYDYKQYTGC